MAVGALIPFVLLVAALAAAKFLAPDWLPGRAFALLARVKTPLWLLNLAVNAALIFVESVAASQDLSDSVCDSCEIVNAVPGRITPFDTAANASVPAGTAVPCEDFVADRVILYSAAAGGAGFTALRVVLAVLCLLLAAAAVLSEEGSGSFGDAVMLGHAFKLTQRWGGPGKGGRPKGDMWYMWGLTFLCMLLIGTVIWGVGIMIFDQRVAFVMAGGVLLAGVLIGAASTLGLQARGREVEVSQERATTFKMLAGDVLLSVMLAQSVFGDLAGGADSENEVAFFTAGLAAPWMMSAALSTVTQGSVLRHGPVTKVLSFIAALTLFFSFLVLPITGTDDYLFRFSERGVFAPGGFPDDFDGRIVDGWSDERRCTMESPGAPDYEWLGAKAANPGYVRQRYCTHFAESSDYTLLPHPGLPGLTPECEEAIAQFTQVHNNSFVPNESWYDGCPCAAALDLHPWPEVYQNAGQITLQQAFDLTAGISIALEVLTTLALAALACCRGRGRGSDITASATAPAPAPAPAPPAATV